MIIAQPPRWQTGLDTIAGNNRTFTTVYTPPPVVQPRSLPPQPAPRPVPAELYVPIPPAPVLPVKNDTANNFNRFAKVHDPKVMTQLVNQPQSWSTESGVYTHDTFFNEFELQVDPVYNFWTADELTNDRQTKGSRELSEIPRYIRLQWESAPDLNSRNLDNKVDVNEIDFTKKNKTPVKYSSQIADRGAVVKKGTTFKVPHLNDFTIGKNATANGYITPGAIRASVEVHDTVMGLGSDILPDRLEGINHIDESAFLSNPDTKGLSIGELTAMVGTLTDSANAATEMEPLNESNREIYDGLFKGNYSVLFPSTSAGKMRVSGVSPAESLLSIAMKVPTPASSAKDQLLDIMRKVVKSPAQVPDRDSRAIRVNFFNPSIAGIIDQRKINSMNRPEHIENMVAIAQMLPSLDVLSNSDAYDLRKDVAIPSFQTPEEYSGVEYTGYVIEKYKRNSAGLFQLVQEIDVPHREYTEYIDCQVVYGGVYRYRIRSILRWTRHNSVGFHGYNAKLVQPGRVESDELMPNVSSYFSSGWSPFEYGFIVDTMPPSPPDEITVRPDSRKKTITVTGKIPDNGQLDINAILLFRKVQDSSGRDLEKFRKVAKFGFTNFLYVDKDVEYNQVSGKRYVYAAICTTRHDEVSTYSEQIGCRLNQDFNVRGEFPCDFVSQAGVAVGYYGSFAGFPIRRSKTEVVLDVSKSKLVASGRNALTEGMRNDASYIVRAESLDTGETKDVLVEITHRNMKDFVAQTNLPVNVTTVGSNPSLPIPTISPVVR